VKFFAKNSQSFYQAPINVKKLLVREIKLLEKRLAGKRSKEFH
jgi:hypothetical protein